MMALYYTLLPCCLLPWWIFYQHDSSKACIATLSRLSWCVYIHFADVVVDLFPPFPFFLLPHRLLPLCWRETGAHQNREKYNRFPALSFSVRSIVAGIHQFGCLMSRNKQHCLDGHMAFLQQPHNTKFKCCFIKINFSFIYLVGYIQHS